MGSFVFSPDGRLLASGSCDQTIKLWDPATGALKHTLEGHMEGIVSVAFSPQGGLLASGSYDGTIKLWNPDTGMLKYTIDHAGGRSSFKLNNLSAHTATRLRWEFLEVSSVAFSPDGKLLASGATDGSIKLWDPETGALERNLGDTMPLGTYNKPHNAKCVGSVAFSPQGQLLAAGLDDGTNAHESILDTYPSAVDSIVFSPDGRLLASCCSDSEPIKVWESATGSLKHTLEYLNCRGPVMFSPDSKLLAAGSIDGIARLWDPTIGMLKYTLKGHGADTAYLWSVATIGFSSSCQLLAFGYYDDIIDLWDIATRVLKATLKPHEGATIGTIKSIAFLSDGKLLAVGSEYKIEVWEIATRTLKHIMRENVMLQSVAFLPDSNLLASGSTGGIKFWDTATGAAKRTVKPTDSHCDFDDKSSFLSYLAAKLECFTAQDWRNSFLPGFFTAMNKPSLHNNQWVTIRGQKKSWLPPEYRPSIPPDEDLGVSTVKDGAIALGCRDGRVHVITFST